METSRTIRFECAKRNHQRQTSVERAFERESFVILIQRAECNATTSLRSSSSQSDGRIVSVDQQVKRATERTRTNRSDLSSSGCFVIYHRKNNLRSPIETRTPIRRCPAAAWSSTKRHPVRLSPLFSPLTERSSSFCSRPIDATAIHRCSFATNQSRSQRTFHR